MFGIIDVESYIPATMSSIIDRCDDIGIDPVQAKIFERIYKLPQISVANEASMLDFISKPIEKLQTKYPDIHKTTKIIIYAHTSTMICTYGKSVVRSVQQKFGFKDAVVIGTTMNKCAASIHAIGVAKQYLTKREKNATAIIITGEICYSEKVRLIPNTSVAGDACAAILLSNNSRHGLLAHNTIVDGFYARGVWLQPDEIASYDKQYISRVSNIIKEGLKANKLSLSDIDLLLPHNINVPSWLKVSKELGISSEQIYLDNIPRIGHTLGADVFINLQSALSDHRIHKGNKTFMFSVGLGACYGYAILQH